MGVPSEVNLWSVLGESTAETPSKRNIVTALKVGVAR